MGLFSGLKNQVAPPPLPPAPHPIGVNGFYTQHAHELALQVRERKVAFSGDDFAVKDAVSGQTIFQVKGKVLSLSGKKDVTDAQGKDLFTIRKKHLAIKKTYVGEDAKSGQEIFKLESSFFTMGTKLKVTFRNTAGNGQDITLVLRGDVFDRKAEITLENGQPVARISRSFANAGQLFFDKQTYILSVAPGVDASLLLAICVCLDEVANDESK